jgi:large subunit ribosomal protein L21
LIVDYRDVPTGNDVVFDRVLAVRGADSDENGQGEVQLGTPTVAGAKVTAQVLGPEKGAKLVVQKIRRRKNSRRKTGHRSLFTRVKISKIDVQAV